MNWLYFISATDGRGLVRCITIKYILLPQEQWAMRGVLHWNKRPRSKLQGLAALKQFPAGKARSTLFSTATYKK